MKPTTHEKFPDTHHDIYSRTVFGFWVYLLTDFIIFGTFFAVYAVLRKSTFGGTPANELFNLSYTFTQSLLMIFISYTAGIGSAYAQRGEKNPTLGFFALTFLLGGAFLFMQMDEFAFLVETGNHWSNSAFLSAFFTLIGTHALHVVFGLLWTVLLCIPLLHSKIDPVSMRRLTCLRMFWQFLGVVWVFIFTIVYLIGEA